MLLSPSSSPRRLALLALFLFLAVLILLRQSHYTQNLSIPHRPIGVPTQEAVDDVSEVIHSHKDANTLPDENESAQPESETKPPSTHKTLPYKPKPIPNYRAGKITKVKRLPFQKLQQKIKALIDWKTLDSDYHWPSWDAYKDADYDPNRWEGFEWSVMFSGTLSHRADITTGRADTSPRTASSGLVYDLNHTSPTQTTTQTFGSSNGRGNTSHAKAREATTSMRA